MNDVGYYRRRDELLNALASETAVSCRELADHLGWESTEVRAKLCSLRVDGLAVYQDSTRLWSARP